MCTQPRAPTCSSSQSRRVCAARVHTITKWCGVCTCVNGVRKCDLQQQAQQLRGRMHRQIHVPLMCTHAKQRSPVRVEFRRARALRATAPTLPHAVHAARPRVVQVACRLAMRHLSARGAPCSSSSSKCTSIKQAVHACTEASWVQQAVSNQTDRLVDTVGVLVKGAAAVQPQSAREPCWSRGDYRRKHLCCGGKGCARAGVPEGHRPCGLRMHTAPSNRQGMPHTSFSRQQPCTAGPGCKPQQRNPCTNV